MPGVTVRTETRSGPTNPLRETSSTYFVVGLTGRGPIDEPVEVRSMAEYGRRLGGRVTYGTVFDDLNMFFEEGGSRAFVARVVGPGATAAEVTLDADVTPAVTVRASSPGSWGDNLTVEVTDGGAGTIDLTIRDTATGTVERIRGIEDAEHLFAQAERRLTMVELIDEGADALPDTTVDPVALSGGDDDRTAITDEDYTAALDRFRYELGDGAVAIPGQDADTVGAALIDHAEDNRRIALLSLPQDATPGEAMTAAGDYNSEHAGIFYPWVIVPNARGGTRELSPEGYVAGVRARAHTDEHPGRAPMGHLARSRHVIGVVDDVTREVGDELDDARVSVIRVIASDVRLYGWRSLSRDEDNYALLSVRDLLNRLVAEGEGYLEGIVGRTVDGRGQLLGEVEGGIMAIAQRYASAGALFARFDDDGNELDPGYVVDAGPQVNDALADNHLKAELAVRPSPTAALITLTITRVGFDVAL